MEPMGNAGLKSSTVFRFEACRGSSGVRAPSDPGETQRETAGAARSGTRGFLGFGV